MPPPHSSFDWSMVIAPCCRPATDMGTFQVEPGGYLAWIARFSRGVCGSFNSALYSARPSLVVMRCENRFGSNVGAEASAKISPLLGSIEMITPRPWGDFLS